MSEDRDTRDLSFVDSRFFTQDALIDVTPFEDASTFDVRAFAKLGAMFAARRGLAHPLRLDVSRFAHFADFAPKTLTFDDLLPKPIIEAVPEIIAEEIFVETAPPAVWPPVSRFADFTALALTQFKTTGLSRFMRVEMPVAAPILEQTNFAPLTDVVAKIEEILQDAAPELQALEPLVIAEQPAPMPEVIIQAAILPEIQTIAEQPTQTVTDKIVQAVAEQLVQAVAGQIVQAVAGQLAQTVAAAKGAGPSQPKAQEAAPAAAEQPAIAKPRSTLSLKAKPTTLTLGENGAVTTAASVFLKDNKPEDAATVASAARKKITNSRHFSRISKRSSSEDLAAAFRAEMAMLDRIKADNAGGMPIDPPEEAERRPHPLAKKSWSELLADIDRAPEKIKPEFDFAAAFRAEMEAVLAKQDANADQSKKPVSRKAEPHRTRILAA